jgi:hypothetical protein
MLTFRFGNTSLAFASSDTTWLSYLSQRYSAFADPTPESVFEVHFESTTPDRPQQLTSPLSTHVEVPVIARRPSGFTAKTATTSAEVDLDQRRAALRGPRALYPLDNLLRHLLPSLGEQGALVHGATLANGERGVLACGPSGAGKSTLARLAGEHALCDELSAVHASLKGEYRLSSLPFWQARPGSVELTAVLLLRHGRQHHLAPLSKAEAMRTLSQQVLWPVEVPPAMDRTLGHVSALIEAVPVLEFAFAPDPSAWDFITNQVLPRSEPRVEPRCKTKVRT